jgi:CRISPR-associated protein Csh1
MYLLNKSKKSDKKADMIEPFLRAGKSKKLKQEIETLYFKYKHEIPLNFKKLNNAIALIMAYDEDIKTSEYKDKLLLGLLSENIFFRKDDK